MDDTGRAAKERVSGELTLEKAVGTGAVQSRNYAHRLRFYTLSRR